MVKKTKPQGALAKRVDTPRSTKEPLVVCHEAACGYGHLHDLFGHQERRVVVAYRLKACPRAAATHWPSMLQCFV